MITLPARYRIPKSMVRYTLFAAVVWALFVSFIPLDLTGSVETGVRVALLVVIVVVVLRILRLGTVITADGVVRRGFFGDRSHPWSDVHELDVTDRRVAHTAYGFHHALDAVAALRAA